MHLETAQRHLQDAPHCLLLWRKPPPGTHPAEAFNSKIQMIKIVPFLSGTGIFHPMFISHLKSRLSFLSAYQFEASFFP